MKDLNKTDSLHNRTLGRGDIPHEETPSTPSIDVVDGIDPNESTFDIDKKVDSIIRKRQEPFIPSGTQPEGVIFLSDWKKYKRMTAKIIEFDDKRVVLECLVNREKRIYKEKVFEKELFKNIKLIKGNRLLFIYSMRDTEWKVSIFDKQRLIPESDFPSIDFTKYSDSSFFSND